MLKEKKKILTKNPISSKLFLKSKGEIKKFTGKMWGSSWPLNQLARNAQGISARWNEEMLDNNSKPHGKIKISLKVNTRAI